MNKQIIINLTTEEIDPKEFANGRIPVYTGKLKMPLSSRVHQFNLDEAKRIMDSLPEFDMPDGVTIILTNTPESFAVAMYIVAAFREIHTSPVLWVKMGEIQLYIDLANFMNQGAGWMKDLQEAKRKKEAAKITNGSTPVYIIHQDKFK